MPRKGSNGPYGVGRDVTRLLKGALLQQGMTQKRLAFNAGISESQISRIFSFEKEMTIDQCEDLCVALGVSIADIFDLAIDERVWGREGEFTVGGFLVAEDPLSKMERYELRRESAQQERWTRLEILQGGKSDDFAADSSPDEPEEGDEGFGEGP